MSVDVDRAQMVERMGRRLWVAYQTGRPIDPIRNHVGSDDIGLAYAIQELLTLHRIGEGAKVIGRKIGLTSPAVQAQLGVDRPDFGVLFNDMSRAQDELIGMDRLIEPKIEAEVAFVLAEDLAEPDLDVETVRGSIAYASPALEIVDSRIRSWDISIVDTVADNASSALFVVGDERVDVADMDLTSITMALTCGGDVVSSGTGSACLGDPLNAVFWLAQTCRELGLPLRAGEVILSGALGPMVSVKPSSEYSAVISGIGFVSARFGEEARP